MSCTIVAEIGTNHNGSLETALEMLCLATEAGADVIKFQKRTLPDAVPPAQRDRPKQTPWGRMSYLEYRRRLEFGTSEFDRIDEACRRRDVLWTASAWDARAERFLRKWALPFIKIPSAKLTDEGLVRSAAESGHPIVLSTGMSTVAEIDRAVAVIGRVDLSKLTLLHCTSCYPCEPADCRLPVMRTLSDRYGVPVGYSGHERGLQISLAAAALGAVMIERHFTLDRTAWGSDQAASLEPDGFRRLVRDVRAIEAALACVDKDLLPCERKAREKLRG